MPLLIKSIPALSFQKYGCHLAKMNAIQKPAFHHTCLAQENCTSLTVAGGEHNDKMGNKQKRHVCMGTMKNKSKQLATLFAPNESALIMTMKKINQLCTNNGFYFSWKTKAQRHVQLTHTAKEHCVFFLWL